MMNKLPRLLIWSLLFLLAAPLQAQETSLTLRLSRDFGFGAGNRVEGTFSYRVEGPDTLQRVVFLLDGAEIGEDTEPPFRLQFETGSYALGLHTMSAVGYTADGTELRSNQITREFVSPQETGNFLVWVVVPILVLSFGGLLLTSWLSNRGRRNAGKAPVSGPLGGTICPNCGRPYAIHIWAINLVGGRFDRCPHCGKWKFVRRMPQNVLEAAADALDEAQQTPPPPRDAADDLQRRLDDSRFD